MSERHLIFAPHPDDEQIGCAAVIARAVRAREAVRVVVITSGQNLLAVCAGISADPSPDEVGARREAETLRSCRILGLAEEHILFLGYEDGQIERDSEAIAADCRRQIAGFRPSRIYCTSVWDEHPDHRAAVRAVAAARVAAGSTADIWQYARREILDASGAPCTAVNIRDFYALKRLAMAESSSHIGIISPHQQKPVQADFINVYCRTEECFCRYEA
ncbi:MAG: PIG-L family deacetylase [Kiritimatiellae bacterium]|nr:PIG-L family deacetylase [Kiritimatiellia bacterium]